MIYGYVKEMETDLELGLNMFDSYKDVIVMLNVFYAVNNLAFVD